jgi:hypothetical protein
MIMKKRLLTMLVLMIIAVGTLYALHVTSNSPNRLPNGFERKFLPIEGTITHKLAFTIPVRELAGIWGDSLFLMTGEPGKIYVTDSKLKKPDVILLEDPKIEKIVPRFYTTVRYPEVYILGGNAKAFATGNLITGETKKTDLHLNGIFDSPVMIGDHRFIVRITDSTTLDARFTIIDLEGNIIKQEQDISLGNRDAGMVYSSLLKYDAENKQLVNLHYYDNGYEVFTPELQLLRRSNTIDTINRNPTQVIVKNGTVMHKHPPIAVNGYAAIHKGYLHVRSKLLADNEEKAQFYTHTVIDRYDLSSGKYIGSFYLPNVSDEPIGQFYFINDDKILAFSDRQVVIYNLHLQKRPLQSLIPDRDAVL